MNAHDVCALVRAIEYKPRHAFGCTISDRGVRVYMNAPVAHRNPPVVTVPHITHIDFDVLVTNDVIDRATIETMTLLLYSWIRYCEEHEIKEWFRVEGVKVYDPHVHGSEHEYSAGNINLGGVT